MKEKILLVGGGGHCKAIIDIIEQENKFSIAGIIDKKELIGTKVLGYETIGCDDDLEKLSHTYKYAIVTVGQIKSNTLRVKLFGLLKELDYILPIIISPLAYVSKHSEVDEGSVVMHHALINAGARVGVNVIINTKVLIEHDSIIEDHCHISTGAIINGGVIVKKNSFVGSNATTKEYIMIEQFIKAGSVAK
ncbi:MAG: NeuD/PglB/VioB family sugar acetyltransferase [Sulfurimonas sp.]|nr:NeuD/PglB/VioB family sugar acetyltransferase [Sulfurimonas sp.]